MGLRFKEQNLGECFFLTTSFDNQQKFGNKTGVYEALAESLNHRIKKTDSKLMAYVFMPSYIHRLLSIKGDRLSGFMRDFKKFTAKKTIREITGKRKVWQDRYDRQAIWSEKVLMTKTRYVHDNPVRSGLAEAPETWYY